MPASLKYHVLAQRFIVIPLVIILAFGSCVYLLGDLLLNMKKEVEHANTINHILALSITNHNPAVVSNQVQDILSHTPPYESIMYYTLSANQTLPANQIDNYTLLFKPFVGIHEAITQPTAKNKASPNGYISLTINLKLLRLQWFQQSLPLILLVLLIWLITLSMLLRRLKTLTKRLPHLENLSRNILNNQMNNETIYDLPTTKDAMWLFEHALVHLLIRQKNMSQQIDKLIADKQAMLTSNAKQIRQNSSFQNTLSHELKTSIQRVESGLQLLKNQYISDEQEDAFKLISQGTDDLHAKINQIIQLSRIEKGQAVVQLHQFNPTRLLDDILAAHRADAQQKSLRLSAKIYHADYLLEGDIQKISIILHSLIENAIRFTERGSVEITSQLHHLEKHIRWTLQVTDTGIGISEQYLAHIFEPFFQVNSDIPHSQNSQTVRLFLVDKLVDILGGQITIKSALGFGTKVMLHLTLHDWKDKYERTLLADKSICFWGKDDFTQRVYERSIDAGASIQQFEDRELLTDYLLAHQVDILLIAAVVEYATVIAFVQYFRESEENQRLLIVYYYQDNELTAQQLENLRVEGIDYLEKIKYNQTNVDDLVKQMIAYLN